MEDRSMLGFAQTFRVLAVAALLALLAAAPPAEAGTPVSGPPDLTVSLQAVIVPPYSTGQAFRFNVHVHNSGGDVPANQSSVFRVRLPAGSSFHSAGTSSCTAILLDVTCPLDPLPSGGLGGAQLTVNLPERRPGDGNITFQAEVDPSNIVRPEVRENNNRAQLTIHLEPAISCRLFDDSVTEEIAGDDVLLAISQC
jgi:hypothetical protein